MASSAYTNFTLFYANSGSVTISLVVDVSLEEAVNQFYRDNIRAGNDLLAVLDDA